jgi:hypothetical protein
VVAAQYELRKAGLATTAELWQAVTMGNKNAPKREKKKPKKDKPKAMPVLRGAPKA